MVNNSMHPMACVRHCGRGKEVKFEFSETGKRQPRIQPEGSHRKEMGACLTLHMLCVTASIPQCVWLSDLPLLGDLVRWGKLEKPLVFSGREFGRQHSHSVVRILAPGGHTLCNRASLREGSTGEQGGIRVCGEVT